MPFRKKTDWLRTASTRRGYGSSYAGTLLVIREGKAPVILTAEKMPGSRAYVELHAQGGAPVCPSWSIMHVQGEKKEEPEKMTGM